MRVFELLRGVASGGSSGAGAPPKLGSSVNPIPTKGGGQIMPTLLLIAPPDFKTYLHLCYRIAKSFEMKKVW